MATINWHTLLEAGSPEHMIDVLEQVFDVLYLGGELVVEIPDRSIEPYASAIKAHHLAHPDEPFGTLRDPKPNDDGEYSARYFPDKDEFISMVKAAGFSIGDEDIQTYFIETTDPETGKRRLEVKEYFITARKAF
jgi:hypothetical protein